MHISAEGGVDWVKSGGSDQGDEAKGICLDGAGGAFVTGKFSNSATFGTISITATSGSTDAFVMRVDR